MYLPPVIFIRSADFRLHRYVSLCIVEVTWLCCGLSLYVCVWRGGVLYQIALRFNVITGIAGTFPSNLYAWGR